MISVVPFAFADNNEIPSWVKGVAAFWVQGEITDTEFIEAIEFLVEQKIINLPNFQKISLEVLENESITPYLESIQLVEEEPEPLIHVTTNKKSYQTGDNIIIRGTVPIESSDSVTTVIVTPNGQIVAIAQIVQNNGVFQSIFKAGNTMNVSGEYEVRAQQGSEKNSVTFNFDWDGVTYEAPPPPVAEPEPDQ